MFVFRIPLIMLQYPPLSVRTFPAPSLRELARLQASLRECGRYLMNSPSQRKLTAPSTRGPGARRMAGGCGHLGEVSLHPMSHIHCRGRFGTPLRRAYVMTPPTRSFHHPVPSDCTMADTGTRSAGIYSRPTNAKIFYQHLSPEKS